MSEPSPIDAPRAHRYFAAACFNRAWEHLDRDRRDHAQVEEMLHAAHASAWHWLHVEGRTPTNDSIGYWQLARVYAVAGRPEEARRWARRCLEVSERHALEPFYVAAAHEALARAEQALGNAEPAARHLERARELLPRVEDGEDRDRLAGDLEAIDRTRGRETT